VRRCVQPALVGANLRDDDGLTLETGSRALSQLHAQGILGFSGARQIVLRPFEADPNRASMGAFAEQPNFIRGLICVIAAYAGFYVPVLYVSNRASKRKLSIQRAWPDALDLMLICVESGISVEAAFRKVAEEIGSQSVELAEELVLTNAELSFLQERKQAYENLSIRTGLESVRSVSQALIQAERYGTPVAHALRVLSAESRDARMTAAEKKAAALPPKLTVPMILFFLPVLFAVILGPAGIQISQQNVF